MDKNAKRPAAVLWTGGKDSALAAWRVRESLDVLQLVTFVPDPPREFHAHPLSLIQAQAQAIGLPHQSISITQPYKEGYESAITQLVDQGVEVLVTGDIDRVGGEPNYVAERARGICEVQMPLWQQDRKQLLLELQQLGFEMVCTLAWMKFFDQSPVGKPVDEAGFFNLVKESIQSDYDLCGENGEYHSAALNGPQFQYPLRLKDVSIRQNDGAWGAYEHLCFSGIKAR